MQARRDAAAEQQRARLAGEAEKKETARCRAAAATEAQAQALEERVGARLGQARLISGLSGSWRLPLLVKTLGSVNHQLLWHG